MVEQGLKDTLTPQTNTPTSDQMQNNTPVQSQHSIFPIILIVIGILEAFYFSFQLIALIVITPKITKLYQDIDAKPTVSPIMGIAFLATLLLFAIAQAYYGFWLKKLIRAKGSLPLKHKRVAIALLIISFVFGLFSLILASQLLTYTNLWLIFMI